MRRNLLRRWSRSAAFAVIVLALVGATVAIAGPALGAHDTHLQAALVGAPAYPGVRGHADYESHHGHRGLHIEMWGMRQMAGHTVMVFAGGHRLGAMPMWMGGHCQGHWDTAHGTLPILGPGVKVTIRTKGGAVIARGVFHHEA